MARPFVLMEGWSDPFFDSLFEATRLEWLAHLRVIPFALELRVRHHQSDIGLLTPLKLLASRYESPM
jgi:hypothetical protein